MGEASSSDTHATVVSLLHTSAALLTPFQKMNRTHAYAYTILCINIRICIKIAVTDIKF